MDAIFIFILIVITQTLVTKNVSKRFKILSENYVWTMFAVHCILTATYITYAFITTSDAFGYFARSSRAEDWLSLWGTSTTFIDFVGWPFTHLIGLSFISTMFIFSYFGYLAILFFYIAARENVSLQPVWKKYTPVELVFLLPNLHFWSASFGKGSVILLGLGMFCLGLSRFNRRYFTMLAGGFIVYLVRPHILFAVVISVMLSAMLTSKGIKWYLRWIIFAVSMVLIIYIGQDVAKFTSVEDFDVLNSEFISNRAAELSKSTSGINIQNYSLPMKMFTFWFRPLFFDGLGMMGLIVSFENLFYLFMFWVVVYNGFKNWKNWNGYFRICLFIFLLGSLALAQVTGNLGIAIRQKAQLMPFFFIIYFKSLQFRQSISKTKIAGYAK
ncbi:MAG: hypothetical protein JSR00_02570 [Bacteroidetes bacterium]|nr:hypothetical protein [Bacteroidota bacterium]